MNRLIALILVSTLLVGCSKNANECLLGRGVTGLAPEAQDFHFTVTGDMRDQHAAYGRVLQSINNILGDPGVFHVSPGDIDSTIPDNRAVIDTYCGSNYLWYPLIGNHEVDSGDGPDIEWLRNEYDNGNGVRTPLKNFTNQNGPTGTTRLTYSWDYGNAHLSH